MDVSYWGLLYSTWDCCILLETPNGEGEVAHLCPHWKMQEHIGLLSSSFVVYLSYIFPFRRAATEPQIEMTIIILGKSLVFVSAKCVGQVL